MAINTWTGVTDTNYNTATNWDLGHKPSAGESVAFSGSGNCVMNEATAILEAWDMTGYTGILSSTGNIRIDNTADAVCLFAGGTHTWSGQLLLNPASTKTLSLTSAGKLTACTGLTQNGAGTVVLVDGLSVPATTTLTHTQGFLKTDGASDNSGLTHSWGLFSSSNANTRSLTLGNSTINITGTGEQWNYGNANNLTLSCGTSTLNFTGGTGFFRGGSKTYYTVNFTGAGNTTTVGINTYTNFQKTATALQTLELINNDNFTVNGSCNLSGNSAINRLLVRGITIGTAKTITLGASATCASVSNYVDIQDITMSGGAANERNFQTNSKSAGDCGGNSGITFTTASTGKYFSNAAGGSWSLNTNWSDNLVPLPQDDVSLNRGSAYNNDAQIYTDMPRLCNSLDCTGMTGGATKPRLRFDSNDVTIYGSCTFVDDTLMRMTGSKSVYFAGRSNAIFTPNGRTLTGWAGMYVQKPGATLSMGGALYYDMPFLCNYGTFETVYTIGTRYCLISSGATLNIGDITWTIIGGSATAWNNAGTISTTAGTGNFTIAIAATTANGSFVAKNGDTYNNITIAPGSGVTTFSGAFTFHDMTMASAGAKTVRFTAGTTVTMTGTEFLQPFDDAAYTETPIISGSTRNGNFETAGAGGADVFGSWDDNSVCVSPSLISSVDMLSHDGVTTSKVCSMYVDTNYAGIQQTLTGSGKYYKLTFWAKADSGTPVIQAGSSVTLVSITLSTSWQQFTVYYTYSGAYYVIIKRAAAQGRTIYIDDVQLTEFSGVLIGSTTDGTPWTLNKTSGTLAIDNVFLKDSVATDSDGATGGTTAFYAGANSVNGGNNTGWTFSGLPSSATAFLLIQLSNFVRQTQAASPMGGYNL